MAGEVVMCGDGKEAYRDPTKSVCDTCDLERPECGCFPDRCGFTPHIPLPRSAEELRKASLELEAARKQKFSGTFQEDYMR